MSSLSCFHPFWRRRLKGLGLPEYRLLEGGPNPGLKGVISYGHPIWIGEVLGGFSSQNPGVKNAPLEGACLRQMSQPPNQKLIIYR